MSQPLLTALRPLLDDVSRDLLQAERYQPVWSTALAPTLCMYLHCASR